MGPSPDQWRSHHINLEATRMRSNGENHEPLVTNPQTDLLVPVYPQLVGIADSSATERCRECLRLHRRIQPRNADFNLLTPHWFKADSSCVNLNGQIADLRQRGLLPLAINYHDLSARVFLLNIKDPPWKANTTLTVKLDAPSGEAIAILYKMKLGPPTVWEKIGLVTGTMDIANAEQLKASARSKIDPVAFGKTDPC